MRFELAKHHGIVLDVGGAGSFDEFGASFGCARLIGGKIHLFYAGARDVAYGNASIGHAISKDGVNFEKVGDLFPSRAGTFCAKSATTPVVFPSSGGYYMILAGSNASDSRRGIGVATAPKILGPWEVEGQLASPRTWWEGYDIDCGPGFCEANMLAYYSNVSQASRLLAARIGLKPFDRLIESASWHLNAKEWWRNLVRRIGILQLGTETERTLSARRHAWSPLRHLNGPRGSWNESLYCPGYAASDHDHYLFPATSTYSKGPPFQHCIGVITADSPYFGTESRIEILVNGPEEKHQILPGVRLELALDSPSPLFREGLLWLYYAVMDRADCIWKTALSVYRMIR